MLKISTLEIYFIEHHIFNSFKPLQMFKGCIHMTIQVASQPKEDEATHHQKVVLRPHTGVRTPGLRSQLTRVN